MEASKSSKNGPIVRSDSRSTDSPESLGSAGAGTLLSPKGLYTATPASRLKVRVERSFLSSSYPALQLACLFMHPPPFLMRRCRRGTKDVTTLDAMHAALLTSARLKKTFHRHFPCRKCRWHFLNLWLLLNLHTSRISAPALPRGGRECQGLRVRGRTFKQCRCPPSWVFVVTTRILARGYQVQPAIMKKYTTYNVAV